MNFSFNLDAVIITWNEGWRTKGSHMEENQNHKETSGKMERVAKIKKQKYKNTETFSFWLK